jgi:hypothetical protein
MDKRYQPASAPGGVAVRWRLLGVHTRGAPGGGPTPQACVSIAERLKDQPFTVHSQKFQTTPVWFPM